MHASLNLSIRDINQLVKCHHCNWIIAFIGWMHNYLGGNDNIFYLNQWLTFSQVQGIGLEHAIKKLY
jgi:hypothetical protein